MKYIFKILAFLLFVCNVSAQEIVKIDSVQYVVIYTPLPEAIEKTEKAISGLDRQIEKIRGEIEKEIQQLKQLQTKKIELETALKIMENPAPSKSISSQAAEATPTPPAKKSTKSKAPPKQKKPATRKKPGPIKNE